jgi:hypothetical protein
MLPEDDPSEVETCSKCIYFNDMWNILTSILANKNVNWCHKKANINIVALQTERNYKQSNDFDSISAISTNRRRFSSGCLRISRYCDESFEKIYLFLTSGGVGVAEFVFAWGRYWGLRWPSLFTATPNQNFDCQDELTFAASGKR